MVAASAFKTSSVIEVREFERLLMVNRAGEGLDLNEAFVRREIKGKHLHHH